MSLKGKKIRDLPELLELIDFDKNKNDLDLDREEVLGLSCGTHKKIWWKCRICGDSFISIISSKIEKVLIVIQMNVEILNINIQIKIFME